MCSIPARWRRAHWPTTSSGAKSTAPQILAVVEWDAGPRFSTELVDVDPADVRIGMRVSPVFCDIPDSGVTLLRYRPEPTDV
jgi:hypothetical protein